MKGKRIISLVLTLSLVLSSTVVFALEGVQKNSSINVIPDEVIVKDIGSGAFEIVSEANKQTLYSEDKSVNLVKVENEIYKAKDPTSVGKNEMFLRVKDNIFQKVEKIDLGLINKTNVEEKIKNKKVKKEVAQDLRELAELSETENVETGAILYATAATTYYVGYGNYNYSEEVLYTYQRTSFKDVKKGAVFVK